MGPFRFYSSVPGGYLASIQGLTVIQCAEGNQNILPAAKFKCFSLVSIAHMLKQNRKKEIKHKGRKNNEKEKKYICAYTSK
jgi:hypothetical protein